VEQYKQFWTTKLDALENYLTEIQHKKTTTTKKKNNGKQKRTR